MTRALALVAITAASAYLIAFRLGEDGSAPLAYDVYFYFYPNILHALRSLAAGGSGLLWNPFQNCGQPFFANIETGLIYPLNLLFLVLDPDTALRGVLFGNLVIGGVGSYGLGRELGASRVAALGGALAFVLGSSAYHATLWMPTVQIPYVLLPAAMWCCERLVKIPNLRRTLLLGLVLGVALLPGHPQFVFFICQMVALRLAWSLFDGSERRRLPRVLGGLTFAFVVMLLLGAVQYLPALELVGESVRSGSLRPEEITPGTNLTLAEVAWQIRMHSVAVPFAIVPGIIAAAAVANAARRRAALFYSIAGLLFLALSLGDATPIGRLYYQTPPGQMFRHPLRFMFVTGFCVSVLTSLAIDVLVRGSWSAFAVAVGALVGLHVWIGTFAPIEWWLAGTVLAGGLLAVVTPAARRIAQLAIVGTVALAPILLPHFAIMRFAADDTPLRAHAAVFDGLRERLTPQDRVYLAGPHGDPGFQDKSATLFAVRAISDYELQVSRRYAEYLAMLKQGHRLQSVNQIYFAEPWNPYAMRWPLAHLAAARYIVIPEGPDTDFGSLENLRLSRIGGDDSMGVYENLRALPRAYYVPQIAVVSDAMVRLRVLAAGGADRRRLALVGAVPGSGFLGVPGNQAISEARFAVDDPEQVVLEVLAPERGFLFLADQFFPGWSAAVNGQPAAILLGNHAFRLVEVPKGPVRVEFRYTPRRVWLGALVSSGTLTLWVVMLVWSFRRREDRPGRGRSGGNGGP